MKGEPAPAAWGRYAEAVGRGLRAADLVGAPTRAMLDEAARLYGPFRRTATLPNGRAGIAPGAKEPFVFAAGRMWDEAKNVAALRALDVAWPVRIAGEGSPLGRLSGAATLDLMARASIYALPARYEPFGLSILEAALAGCALVLGDIPSLRENWDGRAIFVAPDGADALRRAVSTLIEDEASRTRLGATARERALELSLPRFGEGYREAYASLRKVPVGGRRCHEHDERQGLLPLAPFRLEPRQRPFSARRSSDRSQSTRPRRSRFSSPSRTLGASTNLLCRPRSSTALEGLPKRPIPDSSRTVLRSGRFGPGPRLTSLRGRRSRARSRMDADHKLVQAYRRVP